MSKQFYTNLNSEDSFRIHSAMWMTMLSSICIYVIGIYVAATVAQLSWLRPISSAITVITGISSLSLRKVSRIAENLKQSERNILMQKHKEALYDEQIAQHGINAHQPYAKDEEIYYQGW